MRYSDACPDTSYMPDSLIKSDTCLCYTCNNIMQISTARIYIVYSRTTESFHRRHLLVCYVSTFNLGTTWNTRASFDTGFFTLKGTGPFPLYIYLDHVYKKNWEGGSLSRNYHAVHSLIRKRYRWWRNTAAFSLQHHKLSPNTLVRLYFFRTTKHSKRAI